MNTKWLPCNLEVEAVLTHTGVWQPDLRKHILTIKLLKVTHFTYKRCMCKSYLWGLSVLTSRHISMFQSHRTWIFNIQEKNMLVTNDNSWPNLSHKFRTFWNFTRCVSFFGYWYSVLARDKTTVSDWKSFNQVQFSCWIFYWYFNICLKKTCKFILMKKCKFNCKKLC